MPKVQGGKYIVFDHDDALGTLHPQYSASLTATPAPLQAYQNVNKLASSSSMNPYRFMGYFCPGYQAADLTNVSAVTSNVLNAVLAFESSTAYGFGISNGSLLHQFTVTSTPAVTNAGVWPHSIVAAGAESGSDLAVYRIGSDTRLFYSYSYSGGTWDVGMYNLDGATFDDDFMSTVPAGSITFAGNTNPHPMVVGIDDVLYMGDANKIHAFDGQVGAAGTKYDSVLVLPSGYRITSFARYQTFLVAFAYFDGLSSIVGNTFERSNCKAFFWDYLSQDPSYVYDLNDNAVTEALEWKGTIACFTAGRQTVNDGSNRFSRLQIFDGTRFTPAVEFIGNPPLHGGAEILGEIIQWNSDGILHQYGPSFDGLPVGLNKTAFGTSVGGSSQLGVVKTLSTLAGTFISTGGAATGGLTQLKTNYSLSSFTTAIVSPSFSYGQMGKIVSVTVEFAKASTGGRALNLYLDGNFLTPTQPVQLMAGVITVSTTQVPPTSTTANIIQKYTKDVNENQLPRFLDLRLIAQWQGGSSELDAPVIKNVTVEYDTVNIVT